MDVEMEELIYEDLADVKTAKVEQSLVEQPEQATHASAAKSSAVSSSSENSERRTITWTNEDGRRLSLGSQTSVKDSENVGERRILKPRTDDQRSVPSSHFGIEAPVRREVIDADQIEDLYGGLQADMDNPDLRSSAIFLHALKPISVYEAEKIFAEFRPTRCALLSPTTALVKFGTEYEAAEALIASTKLLIRIRKHTEPEEGEIDEEDGQDDEQEDTQVRFEKGEDVVVVRDLSRKRKQLADTIELNIDEISNIPPGKWRVVTRHVPQGRHIFVRFAVGFELRQSLIAPYKKEVTESDQPKSNEDYEVLKNYKKRAVRPGLNVFNEQGEELSVRFEHDTRFYEQTGDDEEPEVKAETLKSLKYKEEEIITSNGGKIRSRGRGSKRFLKALEGMEDYD